MIKIKKIGGFTLIELAMVLFILGLLLTSILPPLATSIESEERENTQIQLDEIKETLYGFALRNSYLPCPDCQDNTGNCAALTANDGLEDTIDGAGTDDICATVTGNLPWATLGVKETDAWNQRFIYRVTSAFADRDVPNGSDADGTGCGVATLGVSFSLCSTGDITVNDDGGSPIAQNVPAIVISTGNDFDTASASAFEQENTDGDAIFIDMDFSDDDVNGFDDLIFWLTPFEINSKMVQAGILP